MVPVAKISVGCGQLTWFQFPHADGTPWTEEEILTEIAGAGYEGAPASPMPDMTVAENAALYEKLGMRPAPGYLGAAFWRANEKESILEQARRQAAASREFGCTELYVAPSGGIGEIWGGRTRGQAAGHVTPTDALSDDEYKQFAETLNEVGRITLDAGVASCFHNHVGTPIETREEVDRLMELVDPAVVFLGPDTGHLAWGGTDPVAFFRDYAGQIRTFHIKDIDGDVALRGREAEWDYRTFSQHGVFTELGQGIVDVPAILATMQERDFSGWIIVETDVTQRPTALESAQISRDYLRSLGV
jgi:inosose dehydratase